MKRLVIAVIACVLIAWGLSSCEGDAIPVADQSMPFMTKAQQSALQTSDCITTFTYV